MAERLAARPARTGEAAGMATAATMAQGDQVWGGRDAGAATTGVQLETVEVEAQKMAEAVEVAAWVEAVME